MVYIGEMPSKPRVVRQSISLPAALARRVRSVASARRCSANRVLVDLVESGLDALDRRKARFLAVADALAASDDPAEQVRLKEELARLTFGE